MSPGFRRGVESGLTTLALLALAVLPSRLSVAMRVRGGTLFDRATRALAGATLDLSAVIVPIAAVLLVVVVLAALAPRRRHLWQHLGAPLFALPLCVTLSLVTVMEQEVKAERGAFTTMHEIVEGVGQASFVEGSLGFLRYERIWVPGLVCSALALLVLVTRWRAARDVEVVPWRGWATGLVAVLALGVVAVPGAVVAQAAASHRLSPAALGDPLSSLVETAADLAQDRAPLKPVDLLLQQAFAPGEAATGAARLGWPPRHAPRPTACPPHPHARPLDRSAEPAPAGAALLSALERVSTQLFDGGDGRIAVFQFSLESFRADDLHALHAVVPAELHPFVNGLYAGRPGVLSSRRLFQGGVRSAQGLAAMTCGLGTLPYNLSLIRDFEGFPLRCAPDLLAAAGFQGRFFYGSDPGFDGMARFLRAHGVTELVTQDELPPSLPKGAWSGVTDLALFDEVVKRTAASVSDSPQYALVMSLSNHSPYTPPEDLPSEVAARVQRALSSAPNRATKDDRRRLLTHAYVDAALERFFSQLDASGLAGRSVVVLTADHSTGEDYVWGPDSVDHETDEAKTQVPFLIVLPEALLARVKDRAALEVELAGAQRQLDAQPLSQNDIPSLLLALLSHHPALAALEPAQRWHTLGGQVTSPHFQPGGEPASFLVGINGVDQLYALDREGRRVGAYEDAIFLRTRAERATVTPRLIPIAATLVDVLRAPQVCAVESE